MVNGPSTAARFMKPKLRIGDKDLKYLRNPSNLQKLVNICNLKKKKKLQISSDLTLNSTKESDYLRN